MIPEFNHNDNVIFEVDPEGTGPRWMLNVDKGYSGVWADAIITDIQPTAIWLDAYFPDGEIRRVSFPNVGSTDYEEEQWWYPGYLRGQHDPGPACNCGCGNSDTNGHWLFCVRGTWLRQNGNQSGTRAV